MSVPTLQCGARTLSLSTAQVMGVLNVTPDSFSDGGQFQTLDQALRQASDMLGAGAAIIDVGGESTRPGAKPVSEQQELDRVIPVIESINKELDVTVSIDTSTPVVMREAVKAGAGMINDVRALEREGALAAALQSGVAVCLMHMRGQPETMQQNPEYADVVWEVFDYLQTRIDACENMGAPKQQLLVDPGFGFGKTLEHNLRLLKELAQFKAFDVPVLVGVSRKSMIGAIVNKPPKQRVAGSVAAALLAVQAGANIVRVHDVAATVDALKVYQALVQTEE